MKNDKATHLKVDLYTRMKLSIENVCCVDIHHLPQIPTILRVCWLLTGIVGVKQDIGKGVEVGISHQLPYMQCTQCRKIQLCRI